MFVIIIYCEHDTFKKSESYSRNKKPKIVSKKDVKNFISKFNK